MTVLRALTDGQLIHHKRCRLARNYQLGGYQREFCASL